MAITLPQEIKHFSFHFYAPPCHNIQIDRTSRSEKQDMKDWLLNKGIHSATKCMYTLDKTVQSDVHFTLRLPLIIRIPTQSS